MILLAAARTGRVVLGASSGPAAALLRSNARPPPPQPSSHPRRGLAGHSKWENTRHRKAAQDGNKMKMYAKMSKLIIAAAKEGDEDVNPRLRSLITEAKRAGVPKDNIQRAVEKGLNPAGSSGAELEEIVYEGYGPSGIAVMVDTLTDNRNRTPAELRHIFDKNGGNLSGSVSWLFTRMARFDVPIASPCKDSASQQKLLEEDDLLELVLGAGADDFEADEKQGMASVLCTPQAVKNVQAALEEEMGEAPSFQFIAMPQSTVELQEKEDIEQFQSFLDQVEDQDDVQQVHHNAIIPPTN